MPDPETSLNVTALLRRFSGGDHSAAEEFIHEILPQLRKIALREVRRERHPSSVSPTELINETWSRNLGRGGWPVKNREHFYGLASRAMRQVLVDLARQRLAHSRGGGIAPLSLTSVTEDRLPSVATAEQIVQIDLLMEKLAERNPRQADIVDLHYFGEFSFEEISQLKGLSVRQVRYLWDGGKAWLGSHLA